MGNQVKGESVFSGGKIGEKLMLGLAQCAGGAICLVGSKQVGSSAPR